METLGGVVLALGTFVLYFLPAFVADRRHVRNKSQVRVVNLFLGWTLIGWVVALVMAFSTDTVVPVASGGAERSRFTMDPADWVLVSIAGVLGLLLLVSVL